MVTDRVVGVAGVECEDDEDTLGVSVVAFGDGFELVLSGSVPNLKFDSGIVDKDDLKNVVESDSGMVVFVELSCTVPKHQVAFAHS